MSGTIKEINARNISMNLEYLYKRYPMELINYLVEEGKDLPKHLVNKRIVTKYGTN